MDAHLLWLQDDAAVPLAPLAAALTAPEREELSRFGHEGRRRSFVLSRLLLRRTLAEQLATAPAAIRFQRAANGRLLPADDHGLQFSLSHSRDRLAIIVAPAPCGVDIEQLRPVDTRSVAARYFADSEVARLRTLDDAERQRDFFRLWTLKEAAVKALGVGLANNLGRLAFSLEGPQPRLLNDDGSLQFWQGALADGFLAAAVVGGQEIDWQCRQALLADLVAAA